MQAAQKSILKLFFQKEDLADVDREAIAGMIEKYPYLNALRYLLAAKSKEAANGTITDEQVTAGLYVNNPLWLSHLLNKSMEEEAITQESAPLASTSGTELSTVEPAREAEVQALPLAFQSYHTIDYFASQGIRLRQEDLSKDKFGQQLKSFSEWLRSMKKLPAIQETTLNGNGEDDSRQQYVIQSAAHSIEEKEIVTETMAEVWAKQGNSEKARALYDKLSLQDPSKSAYFAAKIDQLK